MQIRVEVDVKPEELRRFLGLPDVGGLQDDFIEYLRDRVGAAGEFDTSAFLRGNLDNLKNSAAVKRLLAAAKLTVEEEEHLQQPKSGIRKPGAAKKSSAKSTKTTARRGSSSRGSGPKSG